MRERKRGLSEKAVYLLNPLPDVPEEKILEKAGLPLAEPSKIHPFRLSWKYSAGIDAEWVVVEPGEYQILRESEAKEALKELAEKGAAVVEDLQDEDEVLRAKVRALRKAQQFYRSRGQAKINRFRKDRGLTKEDMEELRYDYWPYHVNEAKAAFVAEELARLTRTEAVSGTHAA